MEARATNSTPFTLMAKFWHYVVHRLQLVFKHLHGGLGSAIHDIDIQDIAFHDAGSTMVDVFKPL
jgi:hypothetical protein